MTYFAAASPGSPEGTKIVTFHFFLALFFLKKKDMFQTMIPYRNNMCLIQGLEARVIFTLHATTDLQHVHNPTTMLYT
jgi:hypothetical protein